MTTARPIRSRLTTATAVLGACAIVWLVSDLTRPTQVPAAQPPAARPTTTTATPTPTAPSAPAKATVSRVVDARTVLTSAGERIVVAGLAPPAPAGRPPPSTSPPSPSWAPTSRSSTPSAPCPRKPPRPPRHHRLPGPPRRHRLRRRRPPPGPSQTHPRGRPVTARRRHGVGRDLPGPLGPTVPGRRRPPGRRSPTVPKPDNGPADRRGCPTPAPYYRNCAAARAAGRAPIARTSPGYRTALDRDHNGWACER
ncbi:excalibur calcium-binding domain-containing protein [Actinokineospora soli]|uniref:Excalibur calcium-binding domain-containing protein n=1 Tax=Actinokineospora soli TaxID=1048753 RepID=A0ABW2TGJ9_9PSEU